MDLTPVLVGVGAEVRRDDESTGLDHLGMMVAAAEHALADAGIAGSRVGAVVVPRGLWKTRDPGRIVADCIGAPDARTVLAELGVLQLSSVRRACELLVDGTVDVALVVGGEAKHRQGVAQRAGVTMPESEDTDSDPGETMRPSKEIMAAAEIARRLQVPAHQYAIIESALRAQAGRTPAEQSAHLGALWARFAAVAAANPDAWDRSAPSADRIASAGPGNRMLAAPYTKLLCSQWNVDQSAAMVLTTVATAEAAGVPRDKWVFPLAVAESNYMLTMSERRDLHRWPAFAAAAERLFALAGRTVGDVGPVDLYSCFPAAVQTAANELGLAHERPLTVTGGMTFGGGPLNNYVFQAIVTMARQLRAEPGAVGLTTAVSGLLTKPALALWSTEPNPNGFGWADVTAEADAATAKIALEPDVTGAGTVAGYTVLYDGGEPTVAAAVVDVDGARTVALCEDDKAIASMLESEHVGAPVRVTSAGAFEV